MNKHLIIIALTAMASLSGGCADTHELVRAQTGNQVTLRTTDSFYVAVSKDGAYGNKNYVGSGLMTANILQSKLASKAHTVATGRSHQSFDEALRYASTNNFTYLVYPTILHWEDRATEWSGIPDQVEVKVELVDVSSSKIVDTGTVKGKSGLATFGGDHPQDLLPIPIENYFAGLFK